MTTKKRPAPIGRARRKDGTFTEELRRAIREAEESGRSRYAIARESGVSQSVLSRFMRGERPTITLETLEKLRTVLRLRLTFGRSHRGPKA